MQRAPGQWGPLHFRQVRGLGDNSGTCYKKVKSVFVCQVRQVDLARECQCATWPVGIFPFAYSDNFSHGLPRRIWASSGLSVRGLLLLFTATVVLGCHLRHQARSRS